MNGVSATSRGKQLAAVERRAILGVMSGGVSTWCSIALCLASACGTGVHGSLQQAGTITLEQGVHPTLAMATFVAGASPLGASQGDVGPCSVYCPDDAPPSIAAGTVSITGTATPITLIAAGSPVAYMPDATLPDPAFVAGASLAVHAAGDPAGVPTFDGMVAAPAPLHGYTPPTSVSRGGVTLSWTAVTGTSMQITLAGVGSTAMSPLILCKADDTGSLAVPSDVFEWLPASFQAISIGVARVSEVDIDIPLGAIAIEALDGQTATAIPLSP